MLHRLAAGLLALTLASTAAAQAVVESVSGEVRSGAAALRQGDRLESGSTVTTGPKSRAQLRFDNGLEVLLDEGSNFRVVDFRADRVGHRVVLDLLAGAARIVTGEIASPGQLFLRTPQASFGVVGNADFSIVVGDSAHVAVSRGTVTVAHRAGVTELKPSHVTMVGAGGTPPVWPAATPPPVASALHSLGTMVVSPPATQRSAEAATKAAATPTPATAPRDDSWQFFVGASAGASTIDEAVTKDLLTSGSANGKDTGFKVFAGGYFHRYFGAEIAYVDLGELRYDGTFLGAPVTDGRFAATGVNFSALARLPLGERFAAFAKAGVFVWEAEANDTMSGAAFSSKADGNSASFGLGLSYDITRNLSVRAEAEMFSVAKERASLLSLGLTVNF